MTNHTLHTRLLTSFLPISLSLSSPQGWKCNCTSFLQSLGGKMCLSFFFFLSFFFPSSTTQHYEVLPENARKGHRMQTGGPKVQKAAQNVKLNFLHHSMKWKRLSSGNYGNWSDSCFPKGRLLYFCSPSDAHRDMSPQHDSTRQAFVLDCCDRDRDSQTLPLIAIVSDRLVNKNDPIRAGNCIIGDISFCPRLDCW